MTTARRAPGLALVLTLAFLAFPATAQEAGRMTGLKLEGDKPIQIESDHLEVRENEGVAIFTGNVAVVQGASLLRSGKMTVYYSDGGSSVTSNSSDIDRLEVEGKVYFRSETQVATGDRGSYDMRTEVLVLSGSEVVERTAMDKVAVSRAVNALLEAGRLARSTDAEDRRRSVLVLTPAGQEVYDEIVPEALASERALLANLSPAEQVQLHRLLSKLEGNHPEAMEQLGAEETTA